MMCRHREKIGEAKRQDDVDDFRAEPGQHRERSVVGIQHVRLPRPTFRRRQPREPQTADAVLQGRHRIGRRTAVREPDPAGPAPGGCRRAAPRRGPCGPSSRAYRGVGLSGRMPCVLIRPIVVFSPVMPHQEAGMRTEHPVSVPSAHGARRAATATPEPLLDPPGVRGILGVPRVPRRAEMLVRSPGAAGEFHRVRLAEHDHPLAHQAAHDRRRRRRAMVRAGSPSRRSCIRPSMSMMSLIAIGTPCKGPSAWPERMAWSAASAASRACRCIDLDEGMQLRIVRRDPRQQCIHQIDRRQAPRRDLPRQDMRGSETGIICHL